MASHSINVQSVLVEHTHNGKIYANSGCLIDNKFVLMTANVFIPLLNESKVSLRSPRTGLLSISEFFKHPPKITVVIKNEDSRNHQYKEAIIIIAYISGDIRRSTVKYLYDWTVDTDDKDVQLKEALSLFFIAKIDFSPPYTDEILVCLKALKSQSSQANLRVGDKICVESTPFGNRHFLRCHTRGIVANILGENDCFLLTDVPTAPGSEGSPVFAKFRNDEIPIGLVLSCMSWWKGEWIGLTLTASFQAIFDEILGDNKHRPFVSQTLKNNTLWDNLSRSVAQVTCGTLWGTAILLDKDDGIFVTNSHVIEHANPTLHWNEVNIESRVLYKSPENQIFDIAILSANQADLHQTKMVPVKLTNKRPNIGDKVYSFGFPLFPRPTKPKPTITAGHVAQISKTMLKTSCTVLPGASGGGIFKKDGTLVGIIVCNAKMEENSTTYPRINMAIPIAAVYDVLQEFFVKKDVGVLQKLQEESVQVIREWNFLRGKINDEIPIGLVLSCISWWKGEWIGLTLTASFQAIFDEILGDNKHRPFVLQTLKNNTLWDNLSRSVAQVTCGTLWGTAILLDKDDGIFITNSHVIEHANPTIHWNKVNVESRVLYKSPENPNFDIAILSANQAYLHQTKMVPVKFTNKRPNIGDKVYSFGFPLFPRFTKPKPTITAGHIAQISKTMLKMSCTVLPGASGGRIFKKDGALLLAIVCNAKMEENSTTYPRINMAIPIAAVYDVLQEFFVKKDVGVLQKLQEESVQVIREWNFLRGKM